MPTVGALGEDFPALLRAHRDAGQQGQTPEKQFPGARAALRRRYGWRMTLIDLFSRLGGRFNKRQLIRIQVEGG